MRAIACSGGRPAGRSSPASCPWRSTITRSQTCRMSVKRWLTSRIATPRERRPVDEVEQPADLLRRERRGRLVEQQHARPELERAGHRHELALAAREVAHRPAGDGDGAAELAHRVGGLARHAPAVEQRHRAQPAARLPPQEDVRGDVEVVAQRQVLVDDLDARGPRGERRAERDGLPSSRTVPEVGGKTPLSTLTSVDLPAPLSPIRPTASDASRVKETPASAWMGPKRRPTSSSSSSATLRVDLGDRRPGRGSGAPRAPPAAPACPPARRARWRPGTRGTSRA